MKARITVGLMMALLVGAVTAVPSLAKTDHGSFVTRDVDCSSSIDVGVLLGLSTLETTKSLWVEKRNGQASKLKCRFKGLDMAGWNEEKRLSGFVCSVPAGIDGSWEPVRSRLKVNHRGNGWLKCDFRPME